MSITIVKTEFHQLIDQVQDKELLLLFKEALQYSSSRKEGELWKTLSKQQKDSVLESYEESLNKDNLIPLEDLHQKHKKWLTK